MVISLLAGMTPRANSQTDTIRARVLLLYQQQAETKTMQEFEQGLRASLTHELAMPVEFYQESLDLDRFAGREHSPALVSYFADKYRGVRVDVVVPVGLRAARFALGELRPVLSSVPVVFALSSAPETSVKALPPNVTGRLASPSRFVPTLALARRLQPDAERIVVIGGAGPGDSVSVSAAVIAARSQPDELPVEVITGLPLEHLLTRVRQIPPRSIVLFGNYRQDGRGEAFDPVDIVGTIARATPAPMYAQLRSFVGEGVVGGAVITFADEGMRTGKLVARVLERPARAALPPVEVMEEHSVVDWRQLDRWGLSEKRLPPGTELLFRSPSAWERYGGVVLVSVGVIAAESVLIWFMLLERRRRIAMQAEKEEEHRRAEEAQRQVAHLGRVALVGELAATISHELRQPLAAIRANAEAGFMMAGGGADAQEIREVFASIVTDNDRAAEVIQSVRRLLRKEDVQVATAVDLNQVCRDTLVLLKHDADRHSVSMELSLCPTPPMVTGDRVQIQQVVINLLLNAIEAAATATGPRMAIVQTAVVEKAVELRVRDTGAGVSEDVRARLFDSFFSTKAGGFGLGLVVVRSILERHSGKIYVESHPSGGAVFRIRFPAPAPVLARPPHADAWRPGARKPEMHSSGALLE